MKSVMNDSVSFIKAHKGAWGHSEWEEFLQTMQRNTLTLSEGTSAYLGGVLESIKVFYSLSPALPAPKPATSPAQKPSAAPKPELALKKRVEPKLAAKPVEPKAAAKSVEPKAAAKPAEPIVDKKPAAEKADKKDDLTAIGGVGPALAKKLNAAGIVGFAQIAALTDKDIAQLEKSVIKFTGRIKRDDWVGQAKKLMRN